MDGLEGEKSSPKWQREKKGLFSVVVEEIEELVKHAPVCLHYSALIQTRLIVSKPAIFILTSSQSPESSQCCDESCLRHNVSHCFILSEQEVRHRCEEGKDGMQTI